MREYHIDTLISSDVFKESTIIEMKSVGKVLFDDVEISVSICKCCLISKHD